MKQSADFGDSDELPLFMERCLEEANDFDVVENCVSEPTIESRPNPFTTPFESVDENTMRDSGFVNLDEMFASPCKQSRHVSLGARPEVQISFGNQTRTSYQNEFRRHMIDASTETNSEPVNVKMSTPASPSGQLKARSAANKIDQASHDSSPVVLKVTQDRSKIPPVNSFHIPGQAAQPPSGGTKKKLSLKLIGESQSTFKSMTRNSQKTISLASSNAPSQLMILSPKRGPILPPKLSKIEHFSFKKYKADVGKKFAPGSFRMSAVGSVIPTSDKIKSPFAKPVKKPSVLIPEQPKVTLNLGNFAGSGSPKQAQSLRPQTPRPFRFLEKFGFTKAPQSRSPNIKQESGGSRRTLFEVKSQYLK